MRLNLPNNALPEFQQFLISRGLVPEKKIPDLPMVLDEMRQAIRIKHYSYSTERSYLDWVKRFYDYTLNIKKKDIAVLGLDSADVKDYMGYLALQQMNKPYYLYYICFSLFLKIVLL